MAYLEVDDITKTRAQVRLTDLDTAYNQATRSLAVTVTRSSPNSYNQTKTISVSNRVYSTNWVTFTGLVADAQYQVSAVITYYAGTTAHTAFYYISFRTEPEPAPNIPSKPTGVTNSSVTTTSARVSWNSVSGASWYSYTLFEGYTSVASSTTSSTALNLSYLTPGKEHTFYVSACNNDGCSADGYTIFTTLPAGPVVNDPYLYISQVEMTSVYVSFANLTPGGLYTIQTSTNYAYGYLDAMESASTGFYLTTGLVAGTTYYFRAYARIGSVFSGYSNIVTATMKSLALPPGPVLYKGTQTTSSATMSIGGGGSATHFQIQSRINGGSWTLLPGNYGTTATITSLLNGRTYDFQARGVNASGAGVWSNIITFDIGTAKPPDWVWEFTITQGGNFYNQVDKSVFLMRAAHWNAFTAHINVARAYKLGPGNQYAFTQASTNTTETGMRLCVNQAIDKVNDMLSSNKIANVVAGDTIKAATFQQLRDRLNSV